MESTDNKYQQLLEEAISLTDKDKTDEAINLYEKIIRLDPNWSTPCYNLGLIYKYQLQWELSYKYNFKATELDPNEEAAWWNLGIAATALQNWLTATKAWKEFGLKVQISTEEPQLNFGKSPVRLNPDADGEVVWCKRIDPARAIILNVPLPNSNHRYGDLLLNDGAAFGTRVSNGVEYTVFNELQILTPSKYKTYSIVAFTTSKDDMSKLEKLCNDQGIEMEDWSTIRYLCKQCSEGKVHEHHDNDLPVANKDESHIGLAAFEIDIIKNTLATWRTITLCEHSDAVLEFE